MIVSNVQCNLCGRQMDTGVGSKWREEFVGILIDDVGGRTLISSGDISELELHLCIECIEFIKCWKKV